jgi:hypothetical protein
VAIAAALAYQSRESSSSTSPARATTSAPTRSAPPIRVLRSQHHGALGRADGVIPRGPALSGHGAAVGEAGGAVPAATTVFDDEVPGVARLDPALLAALRRAAPDAAADGAELFVDSGWRSPEYQEQLLQQAISKYGSEEQAARWVATPKTSAHVAGDAVDIGPVAAASWLAAHGAAYGLCQIYANEPWHFELRPGASDHGCPAMYADPTHDPRMQQ